ncbi:MAG: hypothetical protein RDU20_22750 [Desulfomonilaceae bacterium]|nr:hypothetical protein [Desulfomonilaceae bacterium]
MEDWRVLYNYRGTDRDIAGYWRNVRGTPIKSARKVPADSPGFATPMAGVYRYTFETSTSVSCTRISRMDYGNPLFFSGVRPVVADGVVENLNLLSGWAVVAARDARVGDIFEIGVGCLPNTDQRSWFRVLSFGPRLAGHPSSDLTLIALNTSGVPLHDCIVTVANAVRAENHGGPASPFSVFRQSGLLNPVPDADPNGAVVSFEQYSLFGSPHTYARILVDGRPMDILDIAADRIVPGGTQLICDGATVYGFPSGSKYQSACFSLSEQMGTSVSATLYVADGAESVWLRNASGNFVSGPAGVVVTANGEPRGRISAGAAAAFTVRIDPAAPASTALEARSFSLRLLGMDGDRPAVVEHQGTFVVAAGAAGLNVRIASVAERYARPRYSEDPDVPGNFTEDSDGEYVEDERNPGTFIPATEDPQGGCYGHYTDYLAANGIRFTHA